MAHPLHTLFYPKTIAVAGASDRFGSIGRTVFAQLLVQQCADVIIPVNPNHKIVGGQKSFESFAHAATEHQIDTAVIVLSADKIANILRDIAKTSIKNVVLVSDLESPSNSIQNKLDRAAEQARKLNIAFFAVPSIGLVNVFRQPENDACAYIGQSAGIADCVQNYAQERGITFSRFLTLNPQNYPVSTGQIIDFIASEKQTTALLVHISVLDNPRQLMSALKAAARNKIVIVLHTLADSQQDTLFTQALERSHILTVNTLTQFFTAAKLIHTGITSRGKRLAIVSNAPQICSLSIKNLAHTDLRLAEPTNSTTRALARTLAQKSPAYNPLYLPSDSAVGVFQAACEYYLNDENTDAVCLLYAGRNNADSTQVAQVVARLQTQSNKPLLLVWLGSADNPHTQAIFNQQKNLHFKQPEHALHALSQLNAYRTHQQQRYRTGAFHDYRYASVAAGALHSHLKPLLPVAVLPAGKNNTAYFLTALQAYNSPEIHHKSDNSLDLKWERIDPFGYVLILQAHNKTIQLLPPVTPEIIARTLNQLNLPSIIWQDWLLNTSDILCRLPEIHSVSLSLHHNADKGIVCSDVKLNVQDVDSHSGSQNIFAPIAYDAELEIILNNGEKAWLRPVRAEDASLIQRLTDEMSENSRYTRFMSKAPTLPPMLLSRLSNPDYQREFAILLHDEDHNPLAHASYTADADMQSCEFGISIADRLQGHGLGGMLMHVLITRAQAQGFTSIRAEMLANNHAMQKLALKLGFTLTKHPDDTSLVEAHLILN